MQQDVGGLDVSVDDFQLLLEIVQRVDCRDCDLAENVLWNSLLLALADVFVELVERRGHDLHGNPAVAFLEDRAEKLDDVAAVIGLHNHIQVHYPLLLLLIYDAGTADALDGHDLVRLLEDHLVNTPESSAANLPKIHQVIRSEFVDLSRCELQFALFVSFEALATKRKQDKLISFAEISMIHLAGKWAGTGTTGFKGIGVFVGVGKLNFSVWRLCSTCSSF